MSNPNFSVLLFANIGTSPENFFHTGDEDMFLQTYYWYRHHFQDKVKIITLSSYLNHQSLVLEEYTNFIFPTNNYSRYLLALPLRLIWSKISRHDRLSQKERHFVELIKKVDIIHFCGGGNITSLFRNWMYYCYLIILLGKIFNKKIVLTSQTIGPINIKDYLSTLLILNLSQIIALREPRSNLLKYGVFFPKIVHMYDAAYSKDTKPLPKNNQKISLGLSIYDLPGQKKVIIRFLKYLTQKYPIEIVIIPHVFNNESSGLNYMNSIIQTLDISIKTINPRLKTDIKTQMSLPQKIKTLTAYCDILLTNRYHGAVYALANDTPCICLYNNNYYKRKFSGVLSFIYKDTSRYLIDINTPDFSHQLKQKTIRLIRNIKTETSTIAQYNQNNNTQYDLFFNNLNGVVIPPTFFQN
jgi:polysaccharide pyruvyl transferase WcaK-like protein